MRQNSIGFDVMIASNVVGVVVGVCQTGFDWLIIFVFGQVNYTFLYCH